VILHSLTEPVDLFHYFVSSMGIGPNGSAVALNVGLLVLALGLYPFIVHLCQLLWMDPSQEEARGNNRLIVVAFVVAMICLPGLLMTAFFTMAPATIVLHAIGAMLIFVGTVVFGSIFWILLERHKETSWLLRICTACGFIFFGCMVGAMILLVVQYPAEMQAFIANPGQFVVSVLGNMTDERLDWVRFFEWFYIVSIVTWSLVIGGHSIKLARGRNNSK